MTGDVIERRLFALGRQAVVVLPEVAFLARGHEVGHGIDSTERQRNHVVNMKHNAVQGRTSAAVKTPEPVSRQD